MPVGVEKFQAGSGSGASAACARTRLTKSCRGSIFLSRRRITISAARVNHRLIDNSRSRVISRDSIIRAAAARRPTNIALISVSAAWRCEASLACRVIAIDAVAVGAA